MGLLLLVMPGLCSALVANRAFSLSTNDSGESVNCILFAGGAMPRHLLLDDDVARAAAGAAGTARARGEQSTWWTFRGGSPLAAA
jgi:hypothetical protein